MIAPPVAAMAAAVAPAFAPALDRPYRLVTEETREVAGQPRHFSVERRLLFHRVDGALVAEVTLIRLTQDAGGPVGARFEAGWAGLRDRTVRIRLAPDGTPQAVEEEAAVWQALLAGFATLRRADAPAGSLAADPAAPLRALSPDARLVLLASPLRALVAPAGFTTVGTKAVRLPLAGPTSAAVMTVGSERIARDPDGSMQVVTEAAGTTGEWPVTLRRVRRYDPATALLAAEEQETAYTVSGQVHRTTSRTTLDLPVR